MWLRHLIRHEGLIKTITEHGVGGENLRSIRRQTKSLATCVLFDRQKMQYAASAQMRKPQSTDCVGVF